MASSSAIHFPTFSHSIQSKLSILSVSHRIISNPTIPKSYLSFSIPQLGVGFFSSWNGLKHSGISVRKKYQKNEKKGTSQGRVVYASLFGVGAPEALVIGVVALLVFGPKGLAEVARNLGKTLRAFQPTIRELQEVSREFKATLEQEIGLDEVSSSTGAPDSTSSYPSAKPKAEVEPNGTPASTGFSANVSLKNTEVPLQVSAAEQQAEATATLQEQLIESVATQQAETTAAHQEQLTESVATQQAEATVRLQEQLTESVAKEQAESPTPEERLTNVVAEQQAKAASPSDEQPQAAEDISVGAPPFRS